METSAKKIEQKPTVAIVGRTNVGKSTLFNKLIEESRALVSSIAGTTRSPNYGDSIWRGRVIEIVDTGGLEKRSEDPFGSEIREQAQQAIENTDVILFVVDVRVGITPLDRELAKMLARSKKPMILVGNKAERSEERARAASGEWQALGFGMPRPISAVTGAGVGDVLDEVFEKLAEEDIEPPTVDELFHPIKVAIVGKPNVGKSSLLNALVGRERAIVSEIAHTTREPQDTLLRIDDKLFLLIDTAGIRKQMKRGPSLEVVGIKKSIEAIKRADIALFVLDPTESIGSQDRHIAGMLIEQEKGVIFIGNKWDLIPEKTPSTQTTMEEQIRRQFPFLEWAPLMFVSAKEGTHVNKLFALIEHVAENRKREITPNALDKFFRTAIKSHRPARGKGVKHPYIYGMKQIGTEPPAFIIAVRGRRESVHPSYLRFLENRLREKFDFDGTAIVLKSKAIRPMPGVGSRSE